MTEIVQAIKTPHDCLLLQMDTDFIHGWCTADYVKSNVSKSSVISFTRKTNMILFEYKLIRILLKIGNYSWY
jgi:hypothetical protein